MAGKLFIVLALVVMLGQTYGRSADVEGFLNDVVDTPDADIEKMFEEHLSKFADLESMFKEDPSADEDKALGADEPVGGCSGGSCSFCVRKLILRACFTASKVKYGFKLKVTVNGRQVLSRTISVRNPPAICSGSPVGRVCVQVYNVNPARSSACIRIQFRVKIGWIKKRYNVKISCFSLPSLAEDEMMEGLTYQ